MEEIMRQIEDEFREMQMNHEFFNTSLLIKRSTLLASDRFLRWHLLTPSRIAPTRPLRDTILQLYEATSFVCHTQRFLLVRSITVSSSDFITIDMAILHDEPEESICEIFRRRTVHCTHAAQIRRAKSSLKEVLSAHWTHRASFTWLT